ncbi:unnamed protein product [Thlaspi arvense]|uniref:Uncharacterized protein n=1 Tax=Thlaspi arvense TaxID=13288 RepID=A0AAU9R7P7_THLAR|nr:unnamed protein product [Thlaspi arvense]
MRHFCRVPSYKHRSTTGVYQASGISFKKERCIALPTLKSSQITTDTRVLQYSEYLALANTNLQLPDVVGQLLSVQGANLQDTTSTQKIVMFLMLK